MSSAQTLPSKIAVGFCYGVAVVFTFVSTGVLLTRLDIGGTFFPQNLFAVALLSVLSASITAIMLRIISGWAERKLSWRRLSTLLVLSPLVSGISFVAARHWPTADSLIGAIHEQDVRHVRLALWFGIDANSYEYWGWHHLPGRTALTLAAFYGDIQIAKLIVENGADINKIDAWGRTPLIAASAGGSRELVEFFLNQGANVNERKKDSHFPTTAFTAAAGNGHFEVADRLLEAGADRHLGSVHFAGASGRIERLEYLQKRGVDLQESLKPAVRGGHVDCVRYLIEHGCDPYRKGFLGDTPASAVQQLIRDYGKSLEPEGSPAAALQDSNPKVSSRSEVEEKLARYKEIGEILKSATGERND